MTDIAFRILYYLLTLPIVLFALTFHEVCHGLVAHWLGDDTAKLQGRLTLNPAKHIDIFGLICMVLFHFGWAKPVPINARNFKNPKIGMAVSALAGPVSNLLLAFANLLVYAILYTFFPATPVLAPGVGVIGILYYVLILAANINVTFAVFNFIPVPPLDGSRVLLSFLPPKQYFAVMRYEDKIMLGFFIFILADSYLISRVLRTSILGTVLGFCTNHIIYAMLTLISLVF